MFDIIGTQIFTNIALPALYKYTQKQTEVIELYGQ